MDVTLKQVNPINVITYLQFEYYPPIYVTMPNGHFSSTFDTEMLPHIYITSTMRATWPARLIVPDLITLRVYGQQYKLQSSTLRSFLQSTVISCALD
jgi:hypothetical protein